jgi:hypothetical protein
MKKLLLLLFLFSISSNVFADEFEKYEELQERQYMDCYPKGILHTFNTDGLHVYDKHGRFDRELKYTSKEVIKKPDKLIWIFKSTTVFDNAPTKVYKSEWYINFESKVLILENSEGIFKVNCR